MTGLIDDTAGRDRLLIPVERLHVRDAISFTVWVIRGLGGIAELLSGLADDCGPFTDEQFVILSRAVCRIDLAYRKICKRATDQQCESACEQIQ